MRTPTLIIFIPINSLGLGAQIEDFGNVGTRLIPYVPLWCEMFAGRAVCDI